MALIFEWDEAKADGNVRKHTVSFHEASTVFADPLSLTVTDPAHSVSGEERYVTMGLSRPGRLLVVVHTERGDRIRIISARRTTRRERQQYEETP